MTHILGVHDCLAFPTVETPVAEYDSDDCLFPKIMYEHCVTIFRHTNKMAASRIDCKQVIGEVSIVLVLRPKCVKCGLDLILE
ncbi:hypothetical protein [Halomicrococcus sp. NG-SE-24]|uniref:hypothetical protein n=1 Tax=Halomicrococcus sp. NG-SE-24 TaxID=3436928 RepID=UPI003D9834BD